MQRNLTLDAMKLVFATFVVAAHAGFGKQISFEVRYLLYNGLFRVAVPTFFVINGFFFYQNIIAGTGRFETWRNRLAWLYLIWALIFLPLYWPESGKLHVALMELGSALIFGWLHLWYLVSTLGAGILIYKFLRNKSSAVMIALSAAIYALGLTLQYFGNYHFITNPVLYATLEDTAVYRNFLFFGLPFMSMGYLIAKHDILSQIPCSLIVLIGAVVSVTLVISEASINFHFLGSSKGFDMMFTTLLSGPMLFIAAQNFKIPTSNRTVSELSTGVYLIHPMFLYGLLALHIRSTAFLTAATIALAIISSWILLQFEITRKWLF